MHCLEFMFTCRCRDIRYENTRTVYYTIKTLKLCNKCYAQYETISILHILYIQNSLNIRIIAISQQIEWDNEPNIWTYIGICIWSWFRALLFSSHTVYFIWIFSEWENCEFGALNITKNQSIHLSFSAYIYISSIWEQTYYTYFKRSNLHEKANFQTAILIHWILIVFSLSFSMEAPYMNCQCIVMCIIFFFFSSLYVINSYTSILLFWKSI